MVLYGKVASYEPGQDICAILYSCECTVAVICTQKYDDFSFLNSISVRMLATCFQETV